MLAVDQLDLRINPCTLPYQACTGMSARGGSHHTSRLCTVAEASSGCSVMCRDGHKAYVMQCSER